MKLAVVVLAVLLVLVVPRAAWCDPKPERWEMLISYVDDNSVDRDEKIEFGSDKTTDRAHTDAKVSVILDAIPQSGNYVSIKMVSLAGGGANESSHTRRYKTTQTISVGQGSHRLTTTIDEDFQSKGTLAPLKTTENEMQFTVGSSIVVSGTLHFTTKYKNHSKKVIDSEGTPPIVQENNNDEDHDEPLLVMVSGVEAAKAMATAHRFTATQVTKITEQKLLDLGMKGTITTTVDIHPLKK